MTPNKYKSDWRMHTILCGDTDRKTAWGLWVTGAHVGLHLQDLYPSKSEAMSAARESIGKGWWDHVIVRKVTLGPITSLKS